MEVVIIYLWSALSIIDVILLVCSSFDLKTVPNLPCELIGTIYRPNGSAPAAATCTVVDLAGAGMKLVAKKLRYPDLSIEKKVTVF
jgi:hypothetical protein